MHPQIARRAALSAGVSLLLLSIDAAISIHSNFGTKTSRWSNDVFAPGYLVLKVIAEHTGLMMGAHDVGPYLWIGLIDLVLYSAVFFGILTLSSLFRASTPD